MKGTKQCDAGDDEGSPAEECDGWLLPQPGPDLLLKDWQELKAGAGTAGRRAEDPGLGAGKEVDRAHQFPEEMPSSNQAGEHMHLEVLELGEKDGENI